MRNVAFVLLVLLLFLTLLGGAALVADRRAATRGIPKGLPEPVADADVPPLCINANLHSPSPALDPDQALNIIADGGFAWVQQSFLWDRIEPSPEEYDWAPWDRIVDGVSARGLRLIAVLERAPAWAGTPPPPADFARFAGLFAARYGDRIDHYQVWHNPNLRDGWGAQPNPAAYAELLRQAAVAIRQADPDARILLGSLAPTVETGPDNLSEPRFLDGLYAARAAPYFDIVTAQAYGFHTGPDDRRVDEGVLNFSRVVLIREVMETYGDGGKSLWISHFGWNSLPPEWEDVPSIWGTVDAAAQAEYTVGALERARREGPWLGATCLAHLQPDLTLPAPGDGTPDARRHWGFALVGPDGVPRTLSRAVAEWARRPAANDPGFWTPLSGTATWEGRWEISDLGADPSEPGGDRVVIPFWGTEFGLRVRRGNYRAYLYVTVDGAPANLLPRDEMGRAYVILTSPDYQPQEVTIPVAGGLAPGPHTAVVLTDRGWDQWPLVGWSVGYRPDDRAYRYAQAGLAALALGALVGLVLLGRRAAPSALGRGLRTLWRGLSEGAQMLITAAATLLLWASAWMTWGTETATGAFRRLGDGAGLAATLAAAGLFYYSPWFLLTVLAALILFACILMRPEFGLALIAALAPFYTFPRHLLDKAFSMAEIVTLMTLASWGIRQVRQWLARKRPPYRLPPTDYRLSPTDYRLSPTDYSLLLLVGIALLSTLFADFQRVAWRELRLVILEPAAFYLMLRTSHLDRRDIWRVVDFFVLGGVAVAAIGLVQYALGINLITAEGGLPRLRSVYGSPNNVGLYLGRVLPVLVAVALLGHRSRRRWLYGLAVLPVGAALLLSFSKGALILGVPAALLTVGLLAGGRWLWATLAAVAAVGLSLIPLMRLPRFASLFTTQEGTTTFFRLKLWQGTLAMIRDHFWLGVGPDNFLYHYRSRYILPSAWQEPDLSHPHNFLLDHWARLGILGAAAGIGLQVAFWRTALPLRRLPDRDGRALAIGLMGAMADLLAHGIADHSFFLIDLAFVFCMTVALVHLLPEKFATEERP